MAERDTLLGRWAKAHLIIRALRNVAVAAFAKKGGEGRLVTAAARKTIRGRPTAKSGGEVWAIALEAGSDPRYLRLG
jgi:hypothetical protein